MTPRDQRQQLARLRGLADLVLEARLGELRTAAAARQASLDRLADLERPAKATDLPEIAVAEVALRYQRWADQRRGEINLTLARQTAAWLEARASATQAFGASQALSGLADKLK